MTLSRSNSCWSLFFKSILICTLFQNALPFTLYSKDIYALDGTNTNNFDSTFPFQRGETGEPGGRIGNAGFVDINGTAWIFGGIGSDNNYMNDLWKFSGGLWYWMAGASGIYDPGRYNVTGAVGVPACRAHAAHWVDSAGNFWIFGGFTSSSVRAMSVYLNDMWKYNFADGTWTWIYGNTPLSNQSAPAEGPSRRSKSVSWVHGTKFYLFGGIQSDGNATNDVWEYNTLTGAWRLIYDTQPGLYIRNGGYPPARYGASVATDAQGAWIFGGRTADNQLLSDVWHYTYDPFFKWAGGPEFPNVPGSYPSILGHTGGEPPAREGACSWFDADGYLWIFGGQRTSVNGATFLGDFWKAIPGETVEFVWQGTSDTLDMPEQVNLSAPYAGAPGPRAYVAHWKDKEGNLYFSSGSSPSGTRYDLWVLDQNDCVGVTDCITNCTNMIAQPHQCAPCPPGMEGDGRTNCTDIDECATNNGGCDILTNCTNNFNATPTCSACPPGFNGTGETGCIVFDWCRLPVGSGGCDLLTTCNFTIPNTPPICGPCPWGYNGTGYTGCIDYNECQINNGGCDRLTNCTNNPGALPTCSDCPKPYYSGDGASGCKDVDECKNQNKGGCDPITSCTNNIGAPPTCGPCPNYYVGTGETGCTDFNECLVNNGGCDAQAVCTNNIGGPPTCGPCVSGFIGNNWCSGGSRKNNAGLIAGVTIGGFAALLIVIGLIFYFTKGKTSRSPSTMRLSQSSESAQRFELKALSQA